MKQTNCLDIHSFLKIYFITISRLKFAKNKAEAEISKRIDIILCVRASVNTMQFYDITVLRDYTQLPLTQLKKNRVLSFPSRYFSAKYFFQSQNGQVLFDVTYWPR